MSLLDPSGTPIRKVSDEQLVMAINTVAQRNQQMQMQIMQLGLLVEFLIEKLSTTEISEGKPVFAVNDEEFENFSRRRYEEIKLQAKEFQSLVQSQATPKVNLEG